jgi:hypothetical protein
MQSMKPNAAPFSELVLELLGRGPVPALLASRRAVVLERVARGGGATNLYSCAGVGSLAAVVGRFRPGSVVSFYFDDRIRRAPITDEVTAEVHRIVAETGDALVGFLDEDGIEVRAEIAMSAADLADFLSENEGAGPLLFGPFPSRDNDGIDAVTVVLPDEDGVVRPHPH